MGGCGGSILTGTLARLGSERTGQTASARTPTGLFGRRLGNGLINIILKGGRQQNDGY